MGARKVPEGILPEQESAVRYWLMQSVQGVHAMHGWLHIRWVPYLLCVLILLCLGFTLDLDLALCHLRALNAFLLCMARLLPGLLLLCRLAAGLADVTGRRVPVLTSILQGICLGVTLSNTVCCDAKISKWTGYFPRGARLHSDA